MSKGKKNSNDVDQYSLLAANNSDRPILSQCFMNLKVEGNSVKILFLVIDLNCRDVILGVPFLTRTKLILNSSDRMFCFKQAFFKPHKASHW